MKAVMMQQGLWEGLKGGKGEADEKDEIKKSYFKGGFKGGNCS